MRQRPLDIDRSLQLARDFLGRRLFAQAGGQLTKILRDQPDCVPALQMMGMAAFELGKHSQALECFTRAQQLEPASPSAHMNLAQAYERLGRLDDAAAVLDDALKRGVSIPALTVHPLLAAWKQELCDWRDYQQRIGSLQRMLNATNTKVEGIAHHSLFYWDDPALHRHCAELEFAGAMPSVSAAPWMAPIEGRRIKIAYVSADYRRHPTSRLIAGVLEAHDRQRYEITAVSLSKPDGSPERARIEKAVDHFVDAHDRSGRDIAALMRKRGIDIAVDLMGHTRLSRPDIFLHRAAPVQVNYLGFPGTTGMWAMDYLVVDPFLATADLRRTASERLVILPHCYQSNDDHRPRPEATPRRSDVGLPDNGFVFASFNDARKLTPDTFDAWMRILRQVQGAVLWLLGKSEVANGNLRAEAANRGIDPARLIFAPRVEANANVARIRAADLVLDTFPCGAHSTASDVLWAGRPILTRVGRGFPSRVCGSLLTAMGVPELITSSWTEYEKLAVDLARDSARLQDLTQRVEQGRVTSPLFDTRRFTRHLEEAYDAMAALSATGKPPVEIALAGAKG